MTSFNYMTAIALFTLVGIGCASSPNHSDSDDPPLPEPTIAAGIAAFEDRDIETAQDNFCEGWTANPSDSDFAFGCFFSKLLLLPETDSATAILATFNEPAFDTETDLLGTDDIFAHADEIETYIPWPRFNYAHFELPFAATYRTADGFASFVTDLLEAAIANGQSVHELQQDLLSLLPNLEQLEDLLEVCLADAAFEFTIPAELFYLETDLLTRYNDLRFFMAALKETHVLTSILGAYDIGVEIEDIVQDGVIDHAILVADLNGSGETVNGVTVDTQAFATLSDGDAIRASKTRYVDGMTFLKQALSAFHAGEPSDFFDQALDEFDIARAIDIADEFILAASGSTEMEALGVNLTLNLATFFSTPPDAATLGADSGDPFVLEDGQATPVEAYFEDLLHGVAEF